MVKLDFDPEKDIPSLAGKVILVTGGTVSGSDMKQDAHFALTRDYQGGLGLSSVVSLATHNPAHIFFTGRSQSSADKVVSQLNNDHPDVRVTFISADLSSLQAIKRAAQTFLANADRLDILMANAGIMAVPPQLSEDGYEIQFATNHMGHALLAKLLRPTLEATAQQHGEARIIWLSSAAWSIHPSGGIQIDKLRTTQTDISRIGPSWVRYGQSKLANMLYAREFAKHHPTITSVAVHPGVVKTGLVTELSLPLRVLLDIANFRQWLTPEQGAWNQQWAATAPLGKGERQVESGRYYEPIGDSKLTGRMSNDDVLAAKLWDWTQEELKGWSIE